MGPTGLLLGILALCGATVDSAKDRSAPFVAPNGEDNNSKDPLPTKSVCSHGVTVNIPFLNDKDKSVDERRAPFVVPNGEDNNSNDPLPKKAVFNNGFTIRIPVLNDEPEYRGTKENVDLNKPYVAELKTDFIERNPAILPDGRTLTEGDMLLTKEQLQRFYNQGEERKAINPDFYSIPGFLDWNARWPPDANGNVIIKYLITNSSANDTAVIKQALQHWMDHTCLQFQEITTGGDFSHVFFSKVDSGCFSNVGRIPGNTGGPTGQKISIGKGCETLGTIVHEVGHAIGFFHEQSRTDRDNYVNVFLENVQSGKEDNFNKELKSSAHGVPYDYTSIMHYGDKFFSKNGQITLSTKDPTLVTLLGQREKLSFRDIKLANIIYNCTQKWEKMCSITTNPCQNEGYIGKNCKCVCRPGTTGTNCQQITGTYYPPLPCGGVVTTTNPISSPFFPGVHNSSLNCVWLIRAPVCQMPKITITAFRAYFRASNGVCDIEGLEIRTNSLFNGTTYCGKGTTYDANNQDLKAGQAFTTTGRELVLNFFSRFLNSNTGFSVTVEFVNSNNCTSTTTMMPTTTMGPTTTMTSKTSPPTITTPTTMPTTTMPPKTMPTTTMPTTTMPPTTMPTTAMPPTTATTDPCTWPLNVTATGSCSLRRVGTKWIWSRSWSYGVFTCTLSVRTHGCPKKLKIHFCYFPCRRWSSFCINHTPLMPWKPLHNYCSSNPLCTLARGKKLCVPTSNFDMQVSSRWWGTRPFVIQVVELPSICHKRIVLSATSPMAMISSANTGGSKNCEWFIEAPAGRKIKVTFKSWTFSRACSRAQTSTGWYGWYRWHWRRNWTWRCQRQIMRCQKKKGGLLISPTGDVFYKAVRPLCSQTTPSVITSTGNQMSISYQRIMRIERHWRRRRPWGKWRGRGRGWRKGRWRRRRGGWGRKRRGGWGRRWRGGWGRRRRGWGRRRGRWGRWRGGRRWWGRWWLGGKWHGKRCGRWSYARTFPRIFEATIMLV